MVTDREATVACVTRATFDGDSSVVEDLVTPDVHAAMPSNVWSAPALAVEIEDRGATFADVALRVVHTTTVADEVWIEWTASVVHVGPFAIDDSVIPPSGRRAELHGATIAEFTGDRICRFRQYWDCSPLLQLA
jgi:hypothetical protein